MCSSRIHLEHDPAGDIEQARGAKRHIRLPPNEAAEMPKAPKNAPPDQQPPNTEPSRHARRRQSRGRCHRRLGHRHRMRPEPDAERDLRLQALAQIREPAVHLDLQGARRAQSAAGAVAGRTAARRHRDVGRQPCAGRGLSRAPARHPRQHRDARGHADGEDREHAGVTAPRRSFPARRSRRPPSSRARMARRRTSP